MKAKKTSNQIPFNFYGLINRKIAFTKYDLNVLEHFNKHLFIKLPHRIHYFIL